MQAPQGSEEWKKQRLGKFTASEISRLIFKKGSLTQGAKTYVMEKVMEVITGIPAKDFSNDAMDRGNELEPDAKQLYEFSTGRWVADCGFIELDADTGGSPDGLIDSDGVAEVKCPKLTIHYGYGTIQSDDGFEQKNKEYYWQMMHNMLCTNRKWCDFISYNPDAPHRLFIYRLNRNEEQIALLKSCLKAAIGYKKEMLDILAKQPKY